MPLKELLNYIMTILYKIKFHFIGIYFEIHSVCTIFALGGVC